MVVIQLYTGINQTIYMERSRYVIIDADKLHFITCTILEWPPIFTHPEVCYKYFLMASNINEDISTLTLRSEDLIISGSLAQDFCSYPRRRNRRIARYETVSTTWKTDKKTSQDADIIKSSLLMARLFLSMRLFN